MTRNGWSRCVTAVVLAIGAVLAISASGPARRLVDLVNAFRPALRRIAWEPDGSTPEAVGDALRARGARPWQVAATAQRIAAAFVEADQAVPESAESDS